MWERPLMHILLGPALEQLWHALVDKHERLRKPPPSSLDYRMELYKEGWAGLIKGLPPAARQGEGRGPSR